MSQPLAGQVPRQVPPAVPLQQRVQFVALLQLAGQGHANAATTASICPGSDRRDLEWALWTLLDEGSIEGPTGRLRSLVALGEDGQFTLTARGQQRLHEDDV